MKYFLLIPVSFHNLNFVYEIERKILHFFLPFNMCAGSWEGRKKELESNDRFIAFLFLFNLFLHSHC